MASGSGWNLWVCLVGVVVRRYIDFLILLPTLLVSVLFCSSIPTFCSFFLCFSFFIIKLLVWCSLKSVTTTLCLLFSSLHILHCTVVITLGNLASFPSYFCLVYDYAVLLLISLLLYTCINQCNLCWNEAL